jgi:sulfide:quinone oxidoreductase
MRNTALAELLPQSVAGRRPGEEGLVPGASPMRSRPSVIEKSFDMMHVCPPQTAPDFIRVSPLADAAGWVDVDQATLRHKTFENIWSLGDVMNAPNAKTAAAARMQAPVVAENLVADMGRGARRAHYDGYGSCPLTVERGKIVLAEFGYGGALLPAFPKWLIDGTKPSGGLAAQGADPAAGLLEGHAARARNGWPSPRSRRLKGLTETAF